MDRKKKNRVLSKIPGFLSENSIRAGVALAPFVSPYVNEAWQPIRKSIMKNDTGRKIMTSLIGAGHYINHKTDEGIQYAKNRASELLGGSGIMEKGLNRIKELGTTGYNNLERALISPVEKAKKNLGRINTVGNLINLGKKGLVKTGIMNEESLLEKFNKLPILTRLVLGAGVGAGAGYGAYKLYKYATSKNKKPSQPKGQPKKWITTRGGKHIPIYE